eukprot:719975-Pelagomonas_calceolata.AAC.1
MTWTTARPHSLCTAPDPKLACTTGGMLHHACLTCSIATALLKQQSTLHSPTHTHTHTHAEVPTEHTHLAPQLGQAVHGGLAHTHELAGDPGSQIIDAGSTVAGRGGGPAYGRGGGPGAHLRGRGGSAGGRGVAAAHLERVETLKT